MSNEVEIYVAGLAEPERSVIAAIYSSARSVVPAAVEGVSYGMPALLYKGKGLIAVMSTKNHIGVYPFANLAELEPTVVGVGLETTKGSIHLRPGQDLPSDLLERMLLRRVAWIDGA
ncbi:MAG: hypothetical protein QOH69_519 [Actinomycetota bacterium]|nr:hypothetical protein [Actinomycetota bacterium]